jgi:S1-C subfamily serine protease
MKRQPTPLMRSRWARLAGALIGSLMLLAASALESHGAAGEPDIRRDAIVRAVEQVMPTVVNIATETIQDYHDWYDELLRRFYGSPRAPQWQKSISLGSGVIIDEEGYVLTNFHVVRRATRIQVKLWDGREFDADPIVATEASDVALLKLRAKPGQKFQAIRLAPDDDLILGETVLAVGNPFGLGGSVTRGILSSKNRRPSTGNEPLNVEDWLQTDAAINPGNSGGPLVNLRGELIGLNVAVYRQGDGERGLGVGFSIPVKQISTALTHFFTPEIMHLLWFGAHLRPGPGNLVVTDVQEGGPASDAGLRVGDTIEQLNGQPAKGLVSFVRALGSTAQSEVRLLVNRAPQRQLITVNLVKFDRMLRERLGLTLLEASANTAQRYGIPVTEGLLIEAVDRGSPAERARLQPGQVLVGIGGRKVADLRMGGRSSPQRAGASPSNFA